MASEASSSSSSSSGIGILGMLGRTVRWAKARRRDPLVMVVGDSPLLGWPRPNFCDHRNRAARPVHQRAAEVTALPIAASREVSEPDISGIPFTQHMMSNGKQVSQWIKRPADIEAHAFALIERGYTFHVELLSDWQTVSLTIVDPENEDDVAIEICRNGPDIPSAVDRLVRQVQL